MDPMQIRLNEALYRERLAAAEQERRRTTWVVVPGPIERLRLTIGRQLLALGRRVRLFLLSGEGNRLRIRPTRSRRPR
jgi:hypothetical protein